MELLAIFVQVRVQTVKVGGAVCRESFLSVAGMPTLPLHIKSELTLIPSDILKSGSVLDTPLKHVLCRYLDLGPSSV